MNLIGSHDTHRVASLLGDPRRVDVAYGLLAAYPGVPMIYAGDEIGLQAFGAVQARIPMPWGRPHRWDHRRLAHTQALFRARAASPALRRGGLRWLHAGDDALVFMREAPGESPITRPSGCRWPWWGQSSRAGPVRPICAPTPTAWWRCRRRGRRSGCGAWIGAWRRSSARGVRPQPS